MEHKIDKIKANPLEGSPFWVNLYTDGGSRGNPGEAAIGYVIYDDQDQPIFEYARPIGIETNNVAEYTAMIEGLKKSLELGYTKIALFMDSELIVKQIKKEYRVKNPDLKILYDKAVSLISKCSYFEIRHVRREKNKEADRLVNLALDKETTHQKSYTEDKQTNQQTIHNPSSDQTMEHKINEQKTMERKTTQLQTVELQQKVRRLRERIQKEEQVVVALSGGVDSSLLAKISHEVLGEKAYAMTIAAANIPEEDIRFVEDFVRETGIHHEFVPVDIFAMEELIKNPQDRCYICKKMLFQAIKERSAKLGIATLYDGSNVDDLSEDRPGMKALQELEIQSPLLEEGFTKADIRDYARSLGLASHDKEAMACMLTRIPYNQEITKIKLRSIEKGEAYLRNLGYHKVRVRANQTMAKIEMEEGQIPVFFATGDYLKVKDQLKELGFDTVVLDLEGYRQGK